MSIRAEYDKRLARMVFSASVPPDYETYEQIGVVWMDNGILQLQTFSATEYQESHMREWMEIEQRGKIRSWKEEVDNE